MQGILMKPDMIQAIVEGRKTNTRRRMNPQPRDPHDISFNGKLTYREKITYPGGHYFGDWQHIRPRYHVGETVYIKEKALYWVSPILEGVEYKKPSDWWTDCVYQDDPEIPKLLADNGRLVLERSINQIVEGSPIIGKWEWKSPLHMPEHYARHFIFIEAVGAERLQEISIQDVLREGMPFTGEGNEIEALWEFIELWNSINAKWKRVYNREQRIYEFWQFPWSEADAQPIPKNAEHPERYHCIPNPWVCVYQFRLELPGQGAKRRCDERLTG